METAELLTPSATTLKITDDLVSGSLVQWFKQMHTAWELSALSYTRSLLIGTALLLPIAAMVVCEITSAQDEANGMKFAGSMNSLSTAMKLFRHEWDKDNPRLTESLRKRIEGLVCLEIEVQLGKERKRQAHLAEAADQAAVR